MCAAVSFGGGGICILHEASMRLWIIEKLSDFCRWRARRHEASARGWLEIEKIIIERSMRHGS